MRTFSLVAFGLVTLAFSVPARAQVQLQIQMGFPVMLPPLVQVQPGVMVVRDFDHEVFFINGYYWTQRDNHWYRARDHRGTWRYVEPRGLPPSLVHHRAGQYRRWQHDEARSWPTAAPAKGNARHWRSEDYQEHPSRGQEHPDDRKGGDKKGDKHDEGHGGPGERSPR